MYTKYATYKNSAKCNFNAIHFLNELMKKDQNENPRHYLKRQMPLPNIHLNKGKYPQSDKEIKNC